MKKLLSVLAIAVICILQINTSLAAENLTLSHTAFNETKNSSAASLSREDFFSYTLEIQNSSNLNLTGQKVNFDMSGILPLADISDTSGGVLTGQNLSFTLENILPGQIIEKTIRLRVKAFLPQFQYIAQSHFGNTVNLSIEALGSSAAAKTTPKTGGVSTTPLFFGAGLVAIFIAIKKNFIKA